MTTLAEYKAAVVAKGYDGATSTTLTSVINAARRRVVNVRRWTFLEAQDATLVTAYGVGTVTVDAAWRIDAVRSTQGLDTWELEYLGAQEVRRLASLDNSPGTPRYWSKRAGKIILFPVPDGVYSLTVDYVAETVPVLAADGDTETVLEPTMIDVVAWAAARELSFRQRDFNGTAYADNEYQTLVAAAIRDDKTPQRQASRQVVSNPNRYGDR